MGKRQTKWEMVRFGGNKASHVAGKTLILRLKVRFCDKTQI